MLQNRLMPADAEKETPKIFGWWESPAIGKALASLGAIRGRAGTDVVDQLVAAQPALIVLQADDAHPAWKAIAREAKLSPATRKMPMLAVAKTNAALQVARGRGPDAFVLSRDFCADPTTYARDHARVVDWAQLARQSILPLPPDAAHGVELFNKGEYFEQHEAFEQAWRAEPGPVRALYQGVLQIGVAYLQIQRGNFDGARKMFQRARQYLVSLPDVCQSIDVVRLQQDARTAQAALEALGPGRVVDFDQRLFRPLALCLSIEAPLNCMVCGGTFCMRDVLLRVTRYWPKLDVTFATRPCCNGHEDLKIRPGCVVRGYIYAAGEPHFSPEETFDAPRLTDVSAGQDGITFVLSGTRIKAPANI